MNPGFEFSAADQQMMAEALQLAQRGLCTTMPNPRVGCLLVRDGEVIGRGWHEMAGGPHAEIAALSDAGENVRGATAFVTLEPCAHQGRTGPCTSALIEAGISRVLVAMEDPDQRVSGQGLEHLRQAGIEVHCGLLKEQAEWLNRGFIKRHRSGRPWVRLKLALSLDGRTALANGDSQWITSQPAREDVQQWRYRACAILTGIGTVLADGPRLNVRLPNARRQPLRVVADSHWQCPHDAPILRGEGGALVCGLEEHSIPAPLAESGAEILALPGSEGRLDLHALMTVLAGREINELHVEAGATLNGALQTAGLVDEYLVYQAPVLLGSDARGALDFGPLQSMDEAVRLRVIDRQPIGDDWRWQLAANADNASH